MDIHIQAKTDQGRSFITGCNGCFKIDQVQIKMYAGHEEIFIDARSCSTGNLINGGLVIEPKAMDKLATEWLEARKETSSQESKDE